jgi:hypothetical protein
MTGELADASRLRANWYAGAGAIVFHAEIQIDRYGM